MFAVDERPGRRGLHRRELLRVGGLSALGLSLPNLLAARAPAPRAASFGAAKNVIFLWLQGGPPQHETFDPKPDAPAEIRGEFRPIATNVPGIHISELLPRTAGIMDRLAVVRSLCTHSDLHDGSGYWVLTGYKYQGQQSRQISPTDWPYFGSIVKMLKPSTKLPAFTSVWLPDVMRLNDNVQPAGQTAGFLGKRWEPERMICDPSDPNFRIEGLALPGDVPALRLSGRQSLLAQVEQHFRKVERGAALKDYDRQMHEAFSVLTSGRAREAFDLSRESKKTRERYGRGRWGACVLLARRLVEAGVRLVHVNWPREGGDSAIDNPMWDTHAQNADRLQDVLCPQFDVGFTALIEDLEQRGLLNETLVVAIGEFGRTPKINANGGRDHWGHVFSFVMAGAGIRTAQVYGASDRNGAYPREGKLEPQDLTATIFHLLGIGHDAFFPHPTGRPLHVTEGEPIHALLGGVPATETRCQSAGNLALVPEYNEDFVLNPGFEEDRPLIRAGSGKRLKGWQAMPLYDAKQGVHFGATVLAAPGGRHAALGFGIDAPAKGKLAEGKILLAQEVRNPRAGQYTLTVRASGVAPSAEVYREVFAKHFACRLVVFGYQDISKDPTKVREFASAPFQPPFGGAKGEVFDTFTLSVTLKSQDDGAYHLSRGVGVAIMVCKITSDPLNLEGSHGFIRVDDVGVAFNPRPRNDDVQV